MSDYSFSIEMDVRDYECDLQGIVNHARYLHYFEHARHQMLLDLGMEFADLQARGVFLVVFRVEADYRVPLKSGDRFIVRSWLERMSKLRFVVNQEILRQPDGASCVKAKIIATSISREGRPIFVPEIFELMEKNAI